MEIYKAKRERRASGREFSSDPEPAPYEGNLKSSANIIASLFPKNTNLGYVKTVLSSMRQGLRGDNGTTHDKEPNNLGCQECEMKYDAFISFASEDFTVIVSLLLTILCKLGIRVWNYKANITCGDSIREKVDEGLRNARFVIVILSPHYIKASKRWTKAECDAIFQLENDTDRKILLPVWHNVSEKDVKSFSPLIAGRSALSTRSMTVAEIAIELASIIREKS